MRFFFLSTPARALSTPVLPFLPLAVLPLAVLLLACGSSVTEQTTGAGASSSSNASSSSSSSSSNGGGGATGTGGGGTGGDGGAPCSPDGHCQSDADCPGPAACVALTECGFKVCEVLQDEATSCDQPGFDQCCDSLECADSEACYVAPFGPSCGGIQQAAHNQCAGDQCDTAADCPTQMPPFQAICAPAFTVGHPKRSCFPGTCAVNSDCTEEPGGVCAPITTACCSGPTFLACVYPSNGCYNQGDCSGQTHCDLDGSAARCLPGIANCPP